LTEVLKLSISPAWRVLLSVAVDGVEPIELSDADQEIARVLLGDVETIDDDARRTIIWRLGRGAAKTTMASATALYTLVTSDLSAVGPGMQAAAVVVSGGGKPGARISVQVARELARKTPPLEALVCEDGDTTEGFSIRRPDGKKVSFISVAASRGGVTLRSYDILILIIDESEFIASNSESAGDGYAVSDRDLFAAARPRLHGPAIFISTPWPAENLTDELFTKNFGNPKNALAALGTSTYMRPEDKRLAHDVAKALADDDEDARREYLCESSSRGGSRMFDAASIDAAITRDRPLVIEAPAGATVGCGIDLGLERDSSAIAVVSNSEDSYDLLEFDEVRPTKNNPLAPRYVIKDRFVPVMNRHGASAAMGDVHYRQSATEHLDAEGKDFERGPEGAQGKYDSYMFVRSLLRTRKLRIPDAPRLIAQLRAVTSRPMPGGLTKISTPRRMGSSHGDIVSALVLACWHAREGGGMPIWATPEFHQGAAEYLGISLPRDQIRPILVTPQHGSHEIRYRGNPPHHDPRRDTASVTERGGPVTFSPLASEKFKNGVRELIRSGQ
jgi:hypothetical protein